MIDRIITRWRLAGVPVNDGATDEALASLQALLGIPLPADLRRFFTLADGMEDGALEEHLVSFWPIRKIVREARGDTGHRETEVAFADVMLDSWRLYLRPERGGVSIRNLEAGVDLPSFTAFCERYLSDPESLGLLK